MLTKEGRREGKRERGREGKKKERKEGRKKESRPGKKEAGREGGGREEGGRKERKKRREKRKEKQTRRPKVKQASAGPDVPPAPSLLLPSGGLTAQLSPPHCSLSPRRHRGLCLGYTQESKACPAVC